MSTKRKKSLLPSLEDLQSDAKRYRATSKNVHDSYKSLSEVDLFGLPPRNLGKFINDEKICWLISQYSFTVVAKVCSFLECLPSALTEQQKIFIIHHAVCWKYQENAVIYYIWAFFWFRSESPFQIFLILIQWLLSYAKSGGDISNVTLAYDSCKKTTATSSSDGQGMDECGQSDWCISLWKPCIPTVQGTVFPCKTKRRKSWFQLSGRRTNVGLGFKISTRSLLHAQKSLIYLHCMVLRRNAAYTAKCYKNLYYLRLLMLTKLNDILFCISLLLIIAGNSLR